MGINQNNANMSDYLKSSANTEADKEDSRLIRQKIHCKFSYVFIYRQQLLCGHIQAEGQGGQAPIPSPTQEGGICTTTVTQDEQDLLQKHQNIVSWDVDETSEWCNNLVLVPKVNGKV